MHLIKSGHSQTITENWRTSHEAIVLCKAGLMLGSKCMIEVMTEVMQGHEWLCGKCDIFGQEIVRSKQGNVS